MPEPKGREYPTILNVESDGKIIALDKFGELNTELNTNTITKEQEYKVFGKLLFNEYNTQSMSRYDKNKDEYDNDTSNHRPDDFYNDRDKKRDWEQQQALDKSKEKNKWLWGILIAILFAVIILFMQFCDRESQAPVDEQNQTENTQQPQSTEQANNPDIEQQDSEIRNEIQSTKDSIKEDNDNTNEKINGLQSKIDEMRNQQNSEKANEVADDYQNTVDKLEKAKTEKENGNDDKMQETLDNVQSDITDIKNKISSWFK